MNLRQFYIELGNLLYAMAKADGMVQEEEIREFYKIVRDELVPLEKSTDEFGTDQAFYSEFEFETLLDRNAGVNESFLSFINFLKANKKDVTPQIKELCLNAARKIAEAFGGVDKSEEIFIERLKHELDKV